MKKIYVKPSFDYVELRPEERLAGSGNCAAERGAQKCPPAGNPGGGQ